jgi:glycosyltransferase involved in cell wall biosynthesis
MNSVLRDVPEVSVVMGVFNGARMLPGTLASILSQDGVDFEFIIVNDGSSDGSGDLLRAFAERDGRVRVVDQKHAGLTRALIRGCREARGAYIARQDVGDSSLPGRLAIEKRALDADQELSFVSCWTEFRGPGGELLYVAKGSGYAAHPVCVLGAAGEPGVRDGPTAHPSVMFRSERYRRVGGYRAEFYFGQDWDLWYRLAEVGKFQMIELPLYQCNLMPGSISASYKQMQDTIGNLAAEALRRRREGLGDRQVLDQIMGIRPVPRQQIPRGRNAAWNYFIGECLRNNGDRRAGAYFVRSLRINPFSAKAWIRLVQHGFGRFLGSSRRKDPSP